jgi:hypothetical protein
MKEKLYRHIYPVSGNSRLEYDKPVVYPINAVLAKTLKPNEAGRVILLATSGGAEKGGANIEEFKKELDGINAGIGASLSYEKIEMPFELTPEVFDSLLSRLLNIMKADKGAEIIADITYGIRPIPMLLFCALNFAEKFFNATVDSIVYGKVEFKEEGKAPENPMLYDITQIYYLNKLIGAMESPNAETAVKMLDNFFNL